MKIYISKISTRTAYIKQGSKLVNILKTLPY